MIMDETEIVIAYKNAKNKHEQIKILAEMNLCKKRDIQEILKRRLGIETTKNNNHGRLKHEDYLRRLEQIKSGMNVKELSAAWGLSEAYVREYLRRNELSIVR